MLLLGLMALGITAGGAGLWYALLRSTDLSLTTPIPASQDITLTQAPIGNQTDFDTRLPQSLPVTASSPALTDLD
jgi:hypothetical protein